MQLVISSLQHFFEHADDQALLTLPRDHKVLLADLYSLLGSLLEGDRLSDAIQMYVLEIKHSLPIVL